MLLAQLVRRARSFAPDSAGNMIAARIAMMAITTSNSIRVKANRFCKSEGSKVSSLRMAYGARYHEGDGDAKCGARTFLSATTPGYCRLSINLSGNSFASCCGQECPRSGRSEGSQPEKLCADCRRVRHEILGADNFPGFGRV